LNRAILLSHERWNAPPMSGGAFLTAVIAHSDVLWRAQNLAPGQMLDAAPSRLP
jgi:hypothetical protein